MQISRKADYAIRALIYVAAINGERTCSINEIAENEKIPREYLAKILKELTQKGFLNSYKGVNGGYRMRKPREEITFLSILEATQGPFIISSCNMDEEEGGCKGKDKCASYEFWNDLQKNLKAIYSDMNLSKIDYDKYYGFLKTK
ncbi:MAG: Rrf2 family transcriptional regulator [candidate division Zixibacteria bacterium]|nr:Rrf2 family transcriptional regulator [candidate division Zixibacteria bacterium]